MNPTIFIKAILACAISGVGSLATAAQTDGVNLAEGLVALVAALTALGVVYQVPNADG